MLSLLLALEYDCHSTMKYDGHEYNTGGDCPEDVACSKMSYDDIKKAFKGEEDVSD